jgi:CheY-like chemotaxis protein
MDRTEISFELARVLLVDDDPASRLTLQTILRAGGYGVDTAASAAEAIGKLDEQEFELVLSDLEMESPEAGLKVIGHARMKAYRPATALLTIYQNAAARHVERHSDSTILIQSEDVPELLTQVANLIGQRAKRQVARQMRHSA